MNQTVLRRAKVSGVVEGGRFCRVRLLGGPRRGEEFDAVLYTAFGPDKPEVGQEVVVNTLGVEMGLGTGGVVFVVPEAGTNVASENENHFVKLPYTPLQFPARLPDPGIPERPGSERGYHEDDETVETLLLSGVPVVVLPLHSHLAPACCAASRAVPGCRVAFVWQEGGALAVEFSDSVGELKRLGLLERVVSSGACFGGDEAPNLYSALELAAGYEVDLVLIGIGPGIVGTATRYGHGGMSAALALNAASALGARPVLAPRLSSADGRVRHRGLSHHTRTVLSVALAGCRVALPESGGELALTEKNQLAGRHEYTLVEGVAGGLEAEFGLTFRSMGRDYEQDPVFFDAAVAAVRLALEEPGGPG
ncbi:MAG: DUF3866 family protein [Rubrobacter sp.]